MKWQRLSQKAEAAWRKLAGELGYRTEISLGQRRLETGMPITVRHRVLYRCEDGTMYDLGDRESGWFVYGRDDYFWMATISSISFVYTGKPYTKDGLFRMPAKITVHRLDSDRHSELTSRRRRKGVQ